MSHCQNSDRHKVVHFVFPVNNRVKNATGRPNGHKNGAKWLMLEFSRFSDFRENEAAELEGRRRFVWHQFDGALSSNVGLSRIREILKDRQNHSV